MLVFIRLMKIVEIFLMKNKLFDNIVTYYTTNIYTL